MKIYIYYDITMKYICMYRVHITIIAEGTKRSHKRDVIYSLFLKGPKQEVLGQFL